MFGFHLPGGGDGRPGHSPDGALLSRSLSAGLPWAGASFEADRASFAWCQPGRKDRLVGWRPAHLESGSWALFNGTLHNAKDIESELGLGRNSDLAAVYATAVRQWGEAADDRLIGEYCALVYDTAKGRVRLSRSPIKAPPLHYFAAGGAITASSVSRVLLACGLEERLDETKLADVAFNNHAEASRGIFAGERRVPLGTQVTLERDGSHRQRRYYDPAGLPEVRLASDDAYVERAAELLDEGTAGAVRGFRRPGATLSSGLDSPLVALSALRVLPSTTDLPTFTFHPLAEWSGEVPSGMLGNERPMVEAFAAMHPRIHAHFVDNRGSYFDAQDVRMMQLTGVAPWGLTNMYPFHGIWQAAVREGCDVLLMAEFGNSTVSATGEWAFVEWFKRGRWRQLYLALKHHRADPRSLARKFVALSLVPFLSDAAWRKMKRWRHPDELTDLLHSTPFRADYVQRHRLLERRNEMGFEHGRFQPHTRQQSIALSFSEADWEAGEIYQAFEQLYGVPQRDPMAYRPLLEFCLRLPVEQWVRDGKQRWLAKRMAAGMMPESQRANPLNGYHDADWAARLAPRRQALLDELAAIGRDPRLAEMIDVERLSNVLREWNGQPSGNPAIWRPLQLAVPRAIMFARYVRQVERRNEP